MKKIVIVILFISFFYITYSEKENMVIDNKLNEVNIINKEKSDKINNFLEGARIDVKNKSIYRNKYYSGGYPPEGEGVCTDVIWRAFKNTGYDLKKEIDKDIKNNQKSYPRVESKPEPNIDFRRVPNLISFFKRHSKELSKEVDSDKNNNFYDWEAGDIVVFGWPVYHIAIVSDKRNKEGRPYIIHNGGPIAMEGDFLLYWHKNVSPVIHRFRWKW